MTKKIIILTILFFTIFIGNIFAICETGIEEESCDDKVAIQILEESKYVENTSCATQYTPVCGKIDTGVRCITEPCPSFVEKTFSNECVLENNNAEFLYEGECKKEIKTESVISIENDINIPADTHFVIEILESSDEKIKEEFFKKSPENFKKIIVRNLAEAENEEERNKIIEKITIVKENQKEIIEKEINDFEIEKIDKRKEILQKKSNEIFSEFDFFINKLDIVIKNIEEKITTQEHKIKIEEIKKEMEYAKKIKAEAWIIFLEVVEKKSKRWSKNRFTKSSVIIRRL